MVSRFKVISVVASVLMAAVCAAQTPASAPAGAPAGSTGMCRDGSYWTGATKKGACHGHKGVQEWYGAGTAAAPANATAAAATTPASAPVVAAAPAAPASAPATKATPAPSNAAAPGGGPDKVWVNSSSKVYHCPADRWYGKTKSGAYMTEAEAIAQGNRADHGKACSK
jgi:hypothetical protein